MFEESVEDQSLFSRSSLRTFSPYSFGGSTTSNSEDDDSAMTAVELESPIHESYVHEKNRYFDQCTYDDQPIQTPQIHKTKHLAFYDTLRGISAICVAIHHVRLGFGDNLSTETLFYLDANPMTRWMTHGSWHVGLFFMLSGRVLAAGSKIDNKKLIANCLKRPFRLALPVLCGLIYVNLLYGSGIYNAIGFNTAFTDEVVKVSKGWPCIDYLRPSIFSIIPTTITMFTIGGNPNYPAGVLWSLSLEFWYSYVIYFLSFLLTNLPKRFGQLALLAFVVHTLYFVQPYIHFVAGFVICQMQKEGTFTSFNEEGDTNAYIPLQNDPVSPTQPTIRREEAFRFRLLRKVTTPILQSLLFILSIALIFTSYFKPFVASIDALLSKDRIQGWPWPMEDGFLYTSFTMLILFLSLECTPLLQRILSRGVYLGKLSFGIYLMHGPLLPLLKVFLAVSIRHGYTGWWFTVSVFIYGLFVLATSHVFVKLDQACVRWIGRAYDWCLTI